MCCITFFFGFFYWILAFCAAFYYSRYAFEIHQDKRDINESTPFKNHQHVFNFLGSFIGWILLWIILPTLWSAITWQDTFAFSTKEIVILFLSFLGITGHFPMIGFGVAKGVMLLIERILKG